MIMTRATAVAVLPLAALLLSACVSQSKYDELQAQNQQLQSQTQQLQGQVAADQVQITRLQGAIKYTVNSDLLFASGSWEMSTPGKQVIAKMAAKLAPTQQSKLVVNGYTDNAPVGRDLMRRGVTSNQDLSQRRADAVMQFMISQGLNPGLVSAQGHGDTDPVAPNDTPAGRSQNRRVEITIATPG